MPRQPRQLSASGLYHIMIRGIDRLQFLIDDFDDIKFLRLLDGVQSDDFRVLAYCLMGNHVHLLVKTSRTEIANMESGMKIVEIRYAAYFNKRYGRIGSLFQDRFKSQPIESRDYFFRVLRYIHNNPTKAGIVQNREDYEWSSYREYFFSRKGFCDVDIEYAQKMQPLSWLLSMHDGIEKNPNAFLEDIPTAHKMSDENIRDLVRDLFGMEMFDLLKVHVQKRDEIIRRLVKVEGVSPVNLSRLTGISRGELRRIAL